MDSRLRFLIVNACGAGFVDFTEWRSTRTDWLGLGLRIRAYERTLQNRVAEIDALRNIAVLGLHGVKPEVLLDCAEKGVQSYRGALMPWYGRENQQTMDDPIDAIVNWYFRFRPDLLNLPKAPPHG